jgi:Dirigent-like protein
MTRGLYIWTYYLLKFQNKEETIIYSSNWLDLSVSYFKAMAAPVVQTANASYFKSSTTHVSCCDQTETNFHLYLHQIGQGPNTNQTGGNTVPPGFGMIVVNDWAILEGLDPSSKLVARAKGHHTNCRENNYCTLFNMVFKDDKCVYIFYICFS